MSAKKNGRPRQPGFEKSLEQLEKIVNEMESGKLALEEMIARFEEGQRLIAFCAKKLNEAECKIEILARKGEQVVAKPFVEGEGQHEQP